MTDEAPRLSRRADGRQRRRLRKAARLLKRKAISDLDYAVIAADAITRMTEGRPIAVNDGIHLASFGARSLHALGIPTDEWEARKDGEVGKDREYGPLGFVPSTLRDEFPANRGSDDPKRWHFVWVPQCTDLLWRADMRLRWRWRLGERYHRWKTRQKEFAPAAYADLWKALFGAIGLVMGLVMGYVLALLTRP